MNAFQTHSQPWTPKPARPASHPVRPTIAWLPPSPRHSGKPIPNSNPVTAPAVSAHAGALVQSEVLPLLYTMSSSYLCRVKQIDVAF